jgi:hypothetical protein
MLHPVLIMVLPMMTEAVRKKELLLLGASQGKGTAAALPFTQPMDTEPDAEACSVT